MVNYYRQGLFCGVVNFFRFFICFDISIVRNVGSINLNVFLRVLFLDLDGYVIIVKRFNVIYGIEIGYCGGVI